MAQFYHHLVTEQSFKLLQELKRRLNFILIGGWAVFVYTQALRSKDIDIVVDYAELGKIRQDYDLTKNDRLKKYEAKVGGVDIDIYLPHYSDLGLPVSEIQRHQQLINGFRVPKAEVLLLLKARAASQRRGSSKGVKDVIDIFSLLLYCHQDFDWSLYHQLIKDHDLQDLHDYLIGLISEQVSLAELNLDQHRLARLKRQILKNLDAGH